MSTSTPSLLPIDPPPKGLDLAADLLDFQAAFLGPQCGAGGDAGFGLHRGLPDQFGQTVAGDLAVAGLP